MKKRHALVLSVLIAVVAVVGVFAAARTVAVGSGTKATSDAAIARQARALDRYQAALNATLAQATGTTPSAAGAAAQPVRIVYHRPPPVVVTTHRSGDGHESEHEAEHAQGVEADD